MHLVLVNSLCRLHTQTKTIKKNHYALRTSLNAAGTWSNQTKCAVFTFVRRPDYVISFSLRPLRFHEAPSRFRQVQHVFTTLKLCLHHDNQDRNTRLSPFHCTIRIINITPPAQCSHLLFSLQVMMPSKARRRGRGKKKRWQDLYMCGWRRLTTSDCQRDRLG